MSEHANPPPGGIARARIEPDYEETDDREFQAAMELHRRRVPDAQWRKFEGYMAEIFGAFGMDLNTDATRETPHRYVQALFDTTSGYDGIRPARRL